MVISFLFSGCNKDELAITRSETSMPILAFENAESLERFIVKNQEGTISGKDIKSGFVSAQERYDEKLAELEKIELSGTDEEYWAFIEQNEDKIWYFDEEDKMQPVYSFDAYPNFVNEKGIVEIEGKIIKIYKDKLYSFPKSMKSKVLTMDNTELKLHEEYLEQDQKQNNFELRGTCTERIFKDAFNKNADRRIDLWIYNGYNRWGSGIRPYIAIKTQTFKEKKRLFGGYKWVNYNNLHYRKETKLRSKEFAYIGINTILKIDVNNVTERTHNGGTFLELFYPTQPGYINTNGNHPNNYVPDIAHASAKVTSQGVIGNPEIWAHLIHNCY